MDTSFWITAWNDLYRPSKFPSIWDDIEKMIERNEIISPMEVKEELKPKDKTMLKWLNDRSQLFLELSEPEQRLLSELLGKFRNLNVVGGTTQPADPYVIAIARIRNATVVTDERPSGGQDLKSNPFAAKKIPDVCTALNLKWLGVSGFVNQMPGQK